MAYKIVSEGFLWQRPGKDALVAAGARIVTLASGVVVCSFMQQSKIGINDFVPVLSSSQDEGKTWSAPREMWPHLKGKWSIFGSVSVGGDGLLYFAGKRIPIDVAGESFWSDANHGIKANELVWAKSGDGGKTWTEPAVIPMKIAGSAEAAGPMCVTREGTWLYVYAPYNTFDPAVKVDRNQLALMRSTDQGKTWEYLPAMRYAEETSNSAEAWVIQLSDGRLISSCWHTDWKSKSDYPNPYVVSSDQGKTWTPVRRVGTDGQTVSLKAIEGGKALLVYNMRRSDKPGVRMAELAPKGDGFEIKSDQAIWYAPQATQDGSSVDHDNWTSFAYGEPSVTMTKGGDLLAVIWSIEPRDFGGIRLIRLRGER